MLKLPTIMVSALVLLGSAGAASAQVRTYDASLGTLPAAQGWGTGLIPVYNCCDTSAVNGCNPAAPTFSGGDLHSDNTGFNVCGTGHQWWFEYSPLYCIFKTTVDPTDNNTYAGTGAFLEFTARVAASTYAQSGSNQRQGWGATFGDWYYGFDVWLVNDPVIGAGYFFGGVYVTAPFTPFDTTVDHTYKVIADETGGHLYIDGVFQQSMPYPAIGNTIDFPFAIFGDSQGLLNVYSDSYLSELRYGCDPVELCPDGDADGVCDHDDNCLSVANPSQLDTDGNGIGAACETECMALMQGGLGSAADASIASAKPYQTFGGANVSYAGAFGGGTAQTLLQFDLSPIPAGAVIGSAMLDVVQTPFGVATVRAHEITAPWNEATVTWASFGGAFAAITRATANSGGVTGPITFDLTALGQEWVDGTTPNYGVLLEQDITPVAYSRIRTSETVMGDRPLLDVCFTVPE